MFIIPCLGRQNLVCYNEMSLQVEVGIKFYAYPTHWTQDNGRAGKRVCGALGQCSVQGPRALKNVVGCGCVLDALLFM
jgi:hypothetical protein